MSNRIINLNISDAYISAIGGSIGATGSGNATTLRMTFDEHWDGTTKTVYFRDANGQNPVSVVVGVDTLVSGTTYDINVPPVTLATAGMASMSVRGVILNATDASKVDRSITTQAVWFKVLDSDITWTGGTINATDKEQLQAEIDALTTVFTSSKAAAETAAATATTKSGEATASATAASGSASTAQEKATSAAGSAASAATSAATATTKAGEASASASNASTSAAAALASQTAAASSASAASSSESAASASETNASASASSASADASTATAAKETAVSAKDVAVAAKGGAETAAETASIKANEAVASATAAAASAAQAAAIVGGDFATHEDVGAAKNEAVSTAAEDATTKANAAQAAAEAASDPSGTANTAVSTHDTNADAHSTLFSAAYSDASTKAAAAQSAAEATAATALAAHTGNTSNPHGVTPAQIGAAKVQLLYCTVPVSWTAVTGGFYTQTVSVPGILASDEDVKADINPGNDNAANKLYAGAWSGVQTMETMENAIKFIFTTVPTVAIPLKLEVTR